MPLQTVTTVQTPRLTVRPVVAQDLDQLMRVNGDAEVTRFLPYAAWRGLDDARAWLARMQALAATGSAQQLVIERRLDAQVIGTVLLFKYDEGSARLELGCVLGRAHWQQGFAREALGAVCSHAFNAMQIRRLEAEVNPANVSSQRLLRALGFRHEGTLRERWVARGVPYDTHLYGCLASEWPPHEVD